MAGHLTGRGQAQVDGSRYGWPLGVGQISQSGGEALIDEISPEGVLEL